MADRMTRPDWEKAGNTAWVRCAACDGWFPVAPSLIDAARIELACPHCGQRFLPDAAGEIERP